MANSRRDFLKMVGGAAGAAAAATVLPWPFRPLSRAEAAELTDYANGQWIPS